MSNTSITPNMNLVVPTVATDPGPDWANNLNADLYSVDGHNHSSGQGVQIMPSGLNINTDLPINGNNLTQTRTVRFTSQPAPLSAAADVGCIYESGVDLYYNDGAGNQVRITQSGSVTGAAGTITGLPSGTASASYSAGTFTFDSATNTPATMALGPLVLGAQVVSPSTTTLQVSASQAVNYTLTLPVTAPANNQVPISDGSGNLSWTLGILPLGSVIALFDNLSGAFSTTATTVPDSHGFVLCQGQTLASGPMAGAVVPNINNTSFILGSNSSPGIVGGNSVITLSISQLPSHTHSFSSSGTFTAGTHTHVMSHDHEWSFVDNATDNMYTGSTQSVSRTSFSNVDTAVFITGGSGTNPGAFASPNATGHFYTTGVLTPPAGTAGSNANTAGPSASSNVTGTTGATGSGSSINILPPFITARYIMRAQ